MQSYVSQGLYYPYQFLMKGKFVGHLIFTFHLQMSFMGRIKRLKVCMLN